ncbi:frizzled-4 [Caerostris extrusa]|uniref:Frizzled-4 n=1 Tax=Caerostris extrusa TaxID=172846 RepID=A0AAV4TMS4_CAEEX|nr:frizzled-4 [Caerostris extrusa]
MSLLLSLKMFYVLISLYVFSAGFVASTDPVCEPIKIETCHDIGYNVTAMPNLVGHELQQDAQLQLQTFTPLIQYGCSSRLRFFLCSVYVPMCTDKVPEPIGPCRALCEDVRDKCQPVLQEFGFPWPAGLNCSKFPPQNNDKYMCMEGPTDRKGRPDSHLRIPNRNSRPSIKTNFERKVPYIRNMGNHYGMCRNLRHSDQYYYINRTQRCAASCTANINFTLNNKDFVDDWLAGWSILCFLCTFFNFLVILLGDYRFRFPEGTIVYISGCFNACAIAYLIRVFAGRYFTSCNIDPQHNASILIQEGLDNMPCTIIFVILYFFKMATDGWWLILCITWYLSTNRKWKQERLLGLSNIFHLFAWGVPSIFTIIVLVMRIIDADELIGICYVGNQSRENLLNFVILPSVLYMCAAFIVMIMGLLPVRPDNYSSVQTHPVEHQVPPSQDSVMSVTGIYMFLYWAPLLSVFGTNVYEYINRDQWFAESSVTGPVVEVFSLRLFMLQIMGIASLFVICSSDAKRKAWQKVLRLIRREKRPVPSFLKNQQQTVNISSHLKTSSNGTRATSLSSHSKRSNGETVV